QYDLTYCAAGIPNALTRDQFTSSVYQLAADAAELERMLTWTGYPRDLWEQDLKKYEDKELSIIKGGKERKSPEALSETERFATELLEKLSSYRKQSSVPMPEMEWGYNCGGHGRGIKISTTPSGGKIQLLSAFFIAFARRRV